MKGLVARLRRGLGKTREGLKEGLQRALGQPVLTDDAADALEEALLRADVGVETTEKLLEALRSGSRSSRSGGSDWAAELLKRELATILARSASDPITIAARPHVIMLVGVNGTGKTTTVGKLAWLHRQQGRRVLVVAADTFRAAANEQLTLWSERAGAEILRSRPGSDPASVAYDGVSAAISRGVDLVLVDTAGRLQTKSGLMEEVKKIHRVIGKGMEGAPHDVLLVLDATTGQNAIQQAREFGKAFDLSGIVLAKIDGTARGGVVIAIADALGLPVRYLGVGEGIEDLVAFNPEEFAEALLSG